MNCLVSLVLAGALASVCVVASAAEAVVEKPLIARTLESFNTDAARIEKQMQAGGLYGYISPAEKGRVDARLSEMRSLLTTHAQESDMPTQDKIALANAQEEINAILSHNDNNRLVCEHVAPVGSHRPVTTCRTFAEIMARRERMENDARKRSYTPQRKGGG